MQLKGVLSLLVTGPSGPDYGAIGSRYRPSVPLTGALFNCLFEVAMESR